MSYGLKLVTGTSHPKLAASMARYLKTELVQTRLEKMPGGEIAFEILENVRGCDVYVIQSTCPPVNDNLMELLFILDALKRASVKRITAVIPYYGYARQDRKTYQEPITAKLVADVITAAGAERILTVDLHAMQIQGFFHQPVDNLKTDSIFITYINEKCSMDEDIIVVTPDSGGAKRARRIAARINAKFCLLDTKRTTIDGVRSIVSMEIIGDIARNAFIVDDIIDTGTTITEAAKVLKSAGVENIYVCASHGVLSNNSVQLIEESSINEVIITDSIPNLGIRRISSKIRIISLAPLLSESIRRMHNEESVSSLFV